MLKKFSLWIYTAIVFQFLTAIAHSLSFFIKNKPANETEQQLMDLMSNYSKDLGAGFHPTMSSIFLSLSITFVLLYLLGGFSNWFLVKKKIGNNTMKGILNINLVIFGACFFVMVFLTFLPPIIMTGLTFISLLIARVTIAKQ